MIGAKGFRAREATANYKRRIRKLVPDEVRAARFANLHGNDEAKPAAEPVQPEPEVTAEAQVEQGADAADATDAGDEAGEEAGDEAADAEGAADETAAEGEAAKPAASKKKAGKAKK